MKKLTFVLSIAFSTMLFSCASDTSNDANNSALNAGQTNKNQLANNPKELAKVDSISAVLQKTSKVIDKNISELNEIESELMKEFDLK